MNEDMKLYRKAVDSHFHILQMAEDGLPVNEILASCFKEGMSYALDIGVSDEGLDTRLSYDGYFPGLYHTAGCSPSELSRFDDDQSASSWITTIPASLETAVHNQRIIAIGEIGLDYYRLYGSKPVQETLFVSQLRMAARFNLPVVIHSRDADSDMIRILTEHAPPRKGIMHCFSSGPETARRCVDLGFYISFAGNITYPRSDSIREAAKTVPLDRLLVETDSPYLSPVPFRGKPNNPGYIGYTIKFIAQLRNIEPEELSAVAHDNFIRLFKVPVRT